MKNTDLIKLLSEMSQIINKNKEYLTELDQPIGDSDHGINMARGFAMVESKIDSLKDKDLATILKQVGMTLVSSVGGSSGPLYGTAFMYAGKAIEGKEELVINDLETILSSMIDGVKMRGKAEINEATMIDAMVPAYLACKEALAYHLNAKEVVSKIYEAASQGAENTIPMIATKGRASYVGERGIGHKDPGAQSFALLTEALKDFIK